MRSHDAAVITTINSAYDAAIFASIIATIGSTIK